MTARRLHQQRVDALLAELDGRRRHLAALSARGARPAGLRDLERELQGVREELAAITAAGS